MVVCNDTIEVKYNEMAFKFINVGEAFVYEDELYMKIVRKTEDGDNVVNLSSGSTYEFDPDMMVNNLKTCEIHYKMILKQEVTNEG